MITPLIHLTGSINIQYFNIFNNDLISLKNRLANNFFIHIHLGPRLT